MVADLISKGLSPAVAEAEAKAEIEFNEQYFAKPYNPPITQEEPPQYETVSVPRIV